ncbi:MAG: HEAT repeat domain-containing protein [Oligoflexus sp.]|nr:HEAT repeat domain-containing protein [Oligoflexus sp.]
MKNRNILIMAFVGFGLTLLIGIVLVLLRNQPSCWTYGENPLLYAVQMNESNANASSHLNGVLQIKIKEAPSIFSMSKPIILEGQFKPLEFTNNGQIYTQFRDFSYAFQIAIDSKCHVQKLSFDGRETFSARRTVQRLLRILALGREGQYSDFLGESEMKLTEDQSDLKAFARVSIRVPAASATLEDFIELTSVKASSFRFEGPLKSLWYPKVTVEEQLLVNAGSKHEAREINYQVTLLQVEVPALSPAQDIGSRFKVNKSLSQDLKGKDRPSIYDNVNDKTPKVLDLKSALDAFRAQLSEHGAEAKSLLIEYLKAHPEGIKDLQKLIETNSFTDQELIHILFVLAKVGSEEAQESMASLIGNEAIDKGTRIRTIFAVGEIRMPNETLVAAVRKEYQGLTSGKGLDELSSTALLNGGLLANNLREVMPGEEDKILSDIEDIYKAAGSPELKANAIDAMGNSSSDAFADEVEASTHSSSDLERKAAYEALSRVPAPGREEILVKALGTDTIAPARLAALQTLKSIGLRSAGSIDEMNANIKREPDSINRATAMQVLGQAIPFQAKAKDVLLEQVAREEDPAVLQAAGRFVSAYDILKAKKKR